MKIETIMARTAVKGANLAKEVLTTTARMLARTAGRAGIDFPGLKLLQGIKVIPDDELFSRRVRSILHVVEENLRVAPTEKVINSTSNTSQNQYTRHITRSATQARNPRKLPAAQVYPPCSILARDTQRSKTE